MRANQSERLAAETEQQREARLQRDREGQQLLLLEQPSVQAKMRKFHSQVKKALLATPPLRGDIVFSVQKL